MGELSSTVAKFVRECCIVGPEHHVAKDALYVAWRTWCAANGERPTDSGVFGRDLIAAEPRIASTKRRDATSGKRKPSYVGIAVADAASVASDSMLQEFKRLIGKSPLPPGAVSP
jgi:putative DNA primase/helicase